MLGCTRKAASVIDGLQRIVSKNLEVFMSNKKQKTILLVEDEAIIAMHEKMTLEKYGYKVLTLDTGEKAVEKFERIIACGLLPLPGYKKGSLEKIGYTVVLVNTADEAIKVVADNNIDLILMDIDLGKGMDGTQAAEIILKEHDIPIIFLSSHIEPDVVEMTEKITSYGYVVKNSSITVLDASIKMAFKLFDANKIIRDELIERKKIDKKLNASETRYRRLFETTQDGILILDALTGMIVDVNPFLIKMLGYSKEQFVEKYIWDIGLFQNIIPNKDNFLELQQNEYIRYEDLPLETATGKIVQVEFISNVYLVDQGKVIQCNIRDITDRKIVEEKLKELYDERELVLKEVHHRIKNNMTTISSLLALQADTLENPIAIKALEDAEGRIGTMMVLYNKLYQSTDFFSVLISDYLPSLIDEILMNFSISTSIVVKKSIDNFALDAKILQPLGIIINELLSNISSVQNNLK